MLIPEASPVTVLGIDDFSFKRGPKFGTILVNLSNHNQHSLSHKRARAEGMVKAVHIMAVNAGGQWQGGITALLFWDWLELEDFWLPETLRGQGSGSSILAQIEQIARKVLLTTFEFQARTFYERHNYKVVGVVEDYPPGSNYYTMVKVL